MEIKKGSKKSKEPKNMSYNIQMIYKTRNEAIKFYGDYSLIASEAKNKAKNETTKDKGLKILKWFTRQETRLLSFMMIIL